MGNVSSVFEIISHPSLMHQVHLAVEHEAGDRQREASGDPANSGCNIASVRVVATVTAPVNVIKAFVEGGNYLFWL
jgi:hypothetical protein